MAGDQAVVSYSITKTINLGNYESVKVQCGLSLPVRLDVESSYDEAKEFVDAKIDEETAKWLL